LAILNELQHNSRINNSELARRISLSQPATHTRLKRLEKLGVIREHVSLLDREKLGLDMICLIQIQLQAHSEASLDHFQQAILAMPEVLECYHLTGQFDYVLKVVLKNRRELNRFLRTKIVPMQEVSQINTNVVLSEIKMTTVLPLSDQ
jgi:DNA-binding Lrp family transcriptional regulator